MLAGKIYLMSDGSLVAMHETAYDAEDILQRLLADYPDLLAGDQMRPGSPRRWLLVEREAGIEDTLGGFARWSLDHLFLDQDAIPTLVEVKRSSDTRIRREVVGQMLDYAANVVAHWPPGEMRSRFTDRAASAAIDPDAAVLNLVDSKEDSAVETFWSAADANMTARRLRLVFVADVIPPELIRIIEFLNESFIRAEVYGVEVRQFVGEGHQTLVSRVVGKTATADQVKQAATGATRTHHWTLEDLQAEALNVGGPEGRRLVDSVADWSTAKGLVPSIGAGKGGPIYVEAKTASGGLVKIASCNATTGNFLWNYSELKVVPPFDDVRERLECNRRLNAIAGVTIDDRYARDATWPTIRAGWLASDEVLAEFYDVIAWTAQRVVGGPTAAEM